MYLLCTLYIPCTNCVQASCRDNAVFTYYVHTMYITCTSVLRCQWPVYLLCTYHILCTSTAYIRHHPNNWQWCTFFQFQVSILFNMTFPSFFANLRTFLHTKGLKNVAVYQSWQIWGMWRKGVLTELMPCEPTMYLVHSVYIQARWRS